MKPELHCVRNVKQNNYLRQFRIFFCLKRINSRRHRFMDVRVATLVGEVFSLELPSCTCIQGAEDMAAQACM